MTLKTVLLRDIACQDRKIVSPDSLEAQRRPYLGLEQIESGTGQILSYESSSVEAKSTTFAFEDRHVLYGKLRPYLNKVAIPDRSGRCSTEIIPLKPQGVDKDYLALLLRSEFVVKAAMSDKTGSRMPRADMDSLLGLEISIHDSFDQQRQIAARLKAQLVEVAMAREAVEKQLCDLKLLETRYREKSIASLTDEPRVSLGELLHCVESGKSFQTTDRKAKPDELGILKVSAVSWDEFRPDESKAVDGDYLPHERHRIKKGDLIISRANTLELVGAVVCADRDYPCRLLSDKTLRLVVDETKVCTDYLLAILKWPEARAHIQNNATGTSDSMRNISQKTIMSIPIPLVSMAKQGVIVFQTNAVNTELNGTRLAVKQQLIELRLLPQKILTQAFAPQKAHHD